MVVLFSFETTAQGQGLFKNFPVVITDHHSQVSGLYLGVSAAVLGILADVVIYLFLMGRGVGVVRRQRSIPIPILVPTFVLCVVFLPRPVASSAGFICKVLLFGQMLADEFGSIWRESSKNRVSIKYCNSKSGEIQVYLSFNWYNNYSGVVHKPRLHGLEIIHSWLQGADLCF